MKLALRIAAVAASLLVAPVADAAPCAGFTDVDGASSFCASVEWMRNRGITQGCTATTYCPDGAVTRLQMAAFLSRMERLLPPVLVDANGTPFGTVLLFGDLAGSLNQRVAVLYRANGRAYALEARAVTDTGEFDFEFPRIFFAQPNCAGTPYLHVGTSPLTRYAAAVVRTGTPLQRRLYLATAPRTSATPLAMASSLLFAVCSNGLEQPTVVPAVMAEDLSLTYAFPLRIE